MTDDYKRKVHEKAKQYIGHWLKVVDFVDDALLKAHDVVAVAGEVADEAVEIAQDGLYKASEKLDQYRAFVLANVEEGEREVYGDEPPVQDEKPLKPTADMSRDEKIDLILEGYGLVRSKEQLDALRACSDAALTQAVNIIRNKK